MVYNMMNCAGFSTSLMGGCSIAWLGIGLLFIIILIARKQLAENLDIGFNALGGMIAGLGAYIVLITITGQAKWGLLGGIILALVGGFVAGQFFESGDGGDFE